MFTYIQVRSYAGSNTSEWVSDRVKDVTSYSEYLIHLVIDSPLG